MSDQEKQPESQPQPQPATEQQKEGVAEKKVPAAGVPEGAKPVAQPDGAGGTPALPGASKETGASEAPKPTAAEVPKPAAPTKPAAPAKPPLEVSANGKALVAAIKDAKVVLDEPKPDSFGNPIFDVAPEKLVETGKALREKLGITFLSCLAPLDWPDRWEVVTHLYDFKHKTWFGLKTKIPKDQLKVPSVASVWPAADWYEREGYDMYGIEFEGHPHLARLLMADDWPTFPLRKDHPMDVEGGY